MVCSYSFTQASVKENKNPLQVLTLGDATLSNLLPTVTLDELEARSAKNMVAVNAVTYISDSEAGGLTFKGCRSLFRKLPFMRGLRELRIHGIGTAQWSLAVTSQTLAQLAAGLQDLPGLQVCTFVVIGAHR
jgi:hypothetical protein